MNGNTWLGYWGQPIPDGALHKNARSLLTGPRHGVPTARAAICVNARRHNRAGRPPLPQVPVPILTFGLAIISVSVLSLLQGRRHSCPTCSSPRFLKAVYLQASRLIRERSIPTEILAAPRRVFRYFSRDHINLAQMVFFPNEWLTRRWSFAIALERTASPVRRVSPASQVLSAKRCRTFGVRVAILLASRMWRSGGRSVTHGSVSALAPQAGDGVLDPHVRAKADWKVATHETPRCCQNPGEGAKAAPVYERLELAK